MKTSKRKIWRIIPLLLIVILCTAFLVYTEQYYHAEESVYAALQSDGSVTVTQMDYGWFFDGPSQADALIFYPGAKVEETAYAPLLHLLAEQGMDVCLVRMPFRMAVFGIGKADQVMRQHDYPHWYIGGHSLGGAMASSYAADHSTEFSGVFLFAAYPAKPFPENIRARIIYGSEDRVINRAKLTEAIRQLPDGSDVYVLEGGNHAQFGNYGKQSGDGDAAISSREQQQKTVEWILMNRQTSSLRTGSEPASVDEMK